MILSFARVIFSKIHTECKCRKNVPAFPLKYLCKINVSRICNHATQGDEIVLAHVSASQITSEKTNHASWCFTESKSFHSSNVSQFTLMIFRRNCLQFNCWKEMTITLTIRRFSILQGTGITVQEFCPFIHVHVH